MYYFDAWPSFYCCIALHMAFTLYIMYKYKLSLVEKLNFILRLKLKFIDVLIDLCASKTSKIAHPYCFGIIHRNIKNNNYYYYYYYNCYYYYHY